MMDHLIINTIQRQEKYQNTISRNTQLQHGIFLTSDISVIDNILDIIDIRNILRYKILEPAVGNGIFIIRLIQAIHKKGIERLILREFINSNLYFTDINNAMLMETNSNIKSLYYELFGEEYNGKLNGFICDFTRIEDIETSIPFLIGEVDYIIGNPPYITLYGRRDKKQSESQREYYLRNYQQFPRSLKNGKLNYIMLFIEQSINMLRPHGTISFIIDLSFFESAFKHTRKFLLDNTHILEIHYNISSFKQVASGQTIIKVKKIPRPFTSSQCITSIFNHKDNCKFEVFSKLWNNPEDEYRFRFDFCNISKKH
jgi:methylase of polypeptide subunit release factors